MADTATVATVDPTTGAVIWEKPNTRSESWGHMGGGGGWSHEESLVIIGGSLLIGLPGANQTQLVALDPATGAERWRKDRARGFNASPVRIALDGKDLEEHSADVPQPPAGRRLRLRG